MELVTDQEFEQRLKKSSGLVLVDFFGTWCEPCKQLHPVLEAVERDYAGRLTVLQINVDDEQATAQKYGIRSVPTCLLFRDGGLVDQFSGFQQKPFIVKMINKYYAPDES